MAYDLRDLQEANRFGLQYAWAKLAAMEILRMRSTTVAIAGFCLALFGFAPSPAFATYTYHFLPPPGSSCLGRVCPLPGAPDYVFDFFPAALTVTDAAVASGRFDLNLYGVCLGTGPVCTGGFQGGGNYQGDIADFVSLTIGSAPGGESATPTTWIGLQGIHVAFNPDGTLTGGVTGGGFNASMFITGDETTWFGSWGADAPACLDQNFSLGAGGGCAERGYWFTSQALPTPVSESDTLWMLAGGLALLMVTLSRGTKERDRKAI